MTGNDRDWQDPYGDGGPSDASRRRRPGAGDGGAGPERTSPFGPDPRSGPFGPDPLSSPRRYPPGRSEGPASLPNGNGYGSSNGFGSQNGNGSGSHNGYGSGSQNGYSSQNGYANGSQNGYGNRSENGSGSQNGYGQQDSAGPPAGRARHSVRPAVPGEPVGYPDQTPRYQERGPGQDDRRSQQEQWQEQQWQQEQRWQEQQLREQQEQLREPQWNEQERAGQGQHRQRGRSEPGSPAARQPGFAGPAGGLTPDTPAGRAGPPGWDTNSGAPVQRTGPPEEGSLLLPGFAGHGGGGHGRGHGQRPRRRRGRFLAPLISLLILVVLVLAVVVIGGNLYSSYSARNANYAGPGTGKVNFVVKPGDTASLLAPLLVSAGVIEAANPFIAAAKNSTTVPGLQPGTFLLHKHMNAALAYAMLVSPKSRIQTAVPIPDGQRLTSILAELSKHTHKPVSEFRAALKSTALGLPSYANGNAEGYLYPATYDIPPGTSALGILQTIVAQFNAQAQTLGLAQAATPAHLTAGQIITAASLLEVEGTPKDYAKVARVIDNRLAAGMPLQFDSTVLYALHKTGFFLSNTQLQTTPSPYNTFLHTGLPPGPIDNPTAAAIEAVLHPAPGNWIYFVTTDPKNGITKFTDSKAQFDQFVLECQANKAC